MIFLQLYFGCFLSDLFSAQRGVYSRIVYFVTFFRFCFDAFLRLNFEQFINVVQTLIFNKKS